jgi:hypothetical protein
MIWVKAAGETVRSCHPAGLYVPMRCPPCLRPVLVAALLAAANGCGGKLAPLPDAGQNGDAGDAGPDADAAAEEAGDCGPSVSSVAPDSGPNSGGTNVVIRGSCFVPGDSAITFATFPSQGSCSSTTECTAVSPFGGYQDFDQPIHVQVTTHVSVDGGATTSLGTSRDVFTFLSGPVCGFDLSCDDTTGFPNMVITCPLPVSFYRLYGHQPQEPPVVATTYSVGTEDFRFGLVACYGDPATTSCSTYVTPVTQSWACGIADFCAQCKALGGSCFPSNPPLCSR